MTPQESAKAFLAGVLAKVPEAQRAQVQAALEASDDVLLEIGNGVKRQSEFSSLMNETAALKKKNEDYFTELSTWHEGKKAELAELATLKANPEHKPALATTTTAADFTKADFEKALDGFGKDAVGFVAATNGLSLKHFHQFGEVLDISALLQDKRINQLGLEGVYNDVFKDKLAAKAQEAAAAKEATLRKEIEEKVRREFADKNVPYVVGNNNGSSPLDAIGKEQSPNVLDAATAEYQRLTSARAGA